MRVSISLVGVAKVLHPEPSVNTHLVSIQLWYPATENVPAGYIHFETRPLPKEEAETIARILDAEYEPPSERK